MGSLPVLDQALGSEPPSPPHLSAAGSSCAPSGHQRLSARTPGLQRRASEGRTESTQVSAGLELQGPGGDAGPAGGSGPARGTVRPGSTRRSSQGLVDRPVSHRPEHLLSTPKV